MRGGFAHLRFRCPQTSTPPATAIYAGAVETDPVITGARLRAAREAAGLSLSALASRTHYSKSLLGMVETGRREVGPEHITAYSRALGVSVAALTAPPGDPLRVAHEWLVTDPPGMVHSAAGRRVGTNLAAEMEQRVIDLRRLDDSISGRDSFPVVNKELDGARAVLRDGSYSEDVGRRLLVVVGELAQLAGWVASDAGHFAEAQRIYLDGHAAAVTAGDRALAGQLLSTLAYQVADVGEPADAVLLARSAVAGATDTTPAGRALLLERVAWANARARDRDGTHRALDAVDDAYDRRTPDIPEPDITYWLDRDEIDVMAGRCFVELGDGASAEPLLSRAIERYPADHVREIALYRTWQAEAYAGGGEFDAARAALAKVPDDTGSDRVRRRVREVERMVTGRAPRC